MKRLCAVVGAGAWCLLAAGTAPAAPAATGSWHVAQRYAIGGAGGWDYLAIDQASRHLYVSRSDRVTVFDLASLKTLQTVAVGAKNPDAILYDPYSHRVFTFNGGSNDASVIDAKSGKLLGHVALPGRPEFAVSDGHGHVFDNIESRDELAEIDPAAMKVTATWPVKDCDSPSGLAIDVAHQRLFSVCQNKVMAVTDAGNGKPVASVPIGEGPDAACFDPQRQLVF